MEKDLLAILLRSENTVFTFKDLSLIWNETNTGLVKKYAYRYVKMGKLYSIRKGVYAKDRNYDRLELANKIFTPAYETVLAREGVVFQKYDRIFVASYLTREVSCDGQLFAFRRIKNTVLLNASGIDNNGTYFIASKERAFLDTVYLNKSYHFDNLSSMNWEECFKLLPMYDNQAMVKRLNSYYKLSKNA